MAALVVSGRYAQCKMYNSVESPDYHGVNLYPIRPYIDESPLLSKVLPSRRVEFSERA